MRYLLMIVLVWVVCSRDSEGNVVDCGNCYCVASSASCTPGSDGKCTKCGN